MLRGSLWNRRLDRRYKNPSSRYKCGWTTVLFSAALVCVAANVGRSGSEQQELSLDDPLSELVDYYEPLYFDPTPMRSHARRKRTLDERWQNQPAIEISFKAHKRKFKLRLESTPGEIFAKDVEIFEDGRPVWYDTSRVVRGTLRGRVDSEIQGVITADGLFDGVIRDGEDEFFIEPAYRYMSDVVIADLAKQQQQRNQSSSRRYRHEAIQTSRVGQPLANTGHHETNNNHNNNSSRRGESHDNLKSTPSEAIASNNHIFHSVIYKGSDVRFPENASYGSISVNGKIRRRRISNFSSMQQTFSRSRRDASELHQSDTAAKIVETVEKDGDMLRYRQILLDPVGTDGSLSSGYGIRSGQRTMWVSSERGATAKGGGVVVDPRKTTCMLYLQADHLFFEKMGSREACIEAMTRHVHKVNSIYKGTDFDQDGRADNISFLIKRVKVHTSASLHSADYRYPDNYGVEKFLELFSEEDYDAFCLAYMFTYRDFEGGTLGLAWTGDLKNAGGVCEKNGHYRGSLKSLNTGIVTLLNYGKHVPPIVSHVTLAHEIGHSFGSPHDPKDDAVCTPGGEAGNYIMFAHATSGDKAHNNRFSPCSLRAINAVLNAKARNVKGCFSEPQWAICGNGVVEEDEECDCGWEDECREPCCVPMGEGATTTGARAPGGGARDSVISDHLDAQPPCTLRKGVVCSPSQGPCCTSDCNLKVGDKCRDDNGCRSSAYCDGGGPKCPLSVSKPNKTICNEEFVCYMGECTGSICTAYGLESCQCTRGPMDAPTKACELCCRLPGEGNPCRSSFEWNLPPYDVPDLFAKPGTPCDHYNGYCDVFQRCREIDPSGPLATLRKLLLSTRTISSLVQLVSHYTPLVVASALAVFVFFLLALRLLCTPPGASTTLPGSLYYKQAATINTEQSSLCIVGTPATASQVRPILRANGSASAPSAVVTNSEALKQSATGRRISSHRPACLVSSLSPAGGGSVTAQVTRPPPVTALGAASTKLFAPTTTESSPVVMSTVAGSSSPNQSPVESTVSTLPSHTVNGIAKLTAQQPVTTTTPPTRSIGALRLKLSSLYGGGVPRRWV